MTTQQCGRKDLEVNVNDKLNSSPQCHPVAKRTNIAMVYKQERRMWDT